MIMVLILKCYNNQDIGENKRVQLTEYRDVCGLSIIWHVYLKMVTSLSGSSMQAVSENTSTLSSQHQFQKK